MYLIDSSFSYLIIRCEVCRNNIDFNRLRATKVSSDKYVLKDQIVCKCGNTAEKGSIVSKRVFDPSEPVKCPKCLSVQIVFSSGDGLDKAAAGGLLLGPIGFLGGLLFSSGDKLVCLGCGHAFNLCERE